jgi:hypothetical protein
MNTDTLCQHEPDFNKVSFDDVGGENVIYVDVGCKHCDQTACIARIDPASIKAKPENLQWD